MYQGVDDEHRRRERGAAPGTGPRVDGARAAPQASADAWRLLYLEPFDGGSHAAFSAALQGALGARCTALTLPGRHWKWRMRGAAAWFAARHGEVLAQPCDIILASAFLPLAEFRGLVPGLARVPAVLYFHENQLAYPHRTAPAAASPQRAAQARDQHFAFTQLVSALAAQRCAFNSAWNLTSFLERGRELLARMPDAVAPHWIDRIAERSVVLGYPLRVPPVAGHVLGDAPATGPARAAGPLILWNHRWEHDKNPEAFFAALERLKARNVPFRLAVCGERFRRAPAVFEQARRSLADHIVQWGWLASRAAYEDLLQRCHLVVSTARQEFFGVSVLEAVWFGARPLVPNRLVYPALYPPACRFADDVGLADALEPLCRGWAEGRLILRADRRALCRAHRTAAFFARLDALVRCVLEEQQGP